MFLRVIKKILIFSLVVVFLAFDFFPAVDYFSKKPISKKIVDKIYLAKQNANVVDNFKFGIQKAQAAEDPAELEYMVDIGPIAGSTSANYVYGSFFNPSGSGRTAVIKRIAVRANANGAGNYVNLSVRRTTAASGGSQISASNIPKKNNDSSDPVTEIRHTGPTVTFAGVVNSRILGQAMPGAAGQFHSYRDITFGANDEKIIIQPNQGVALYQEAAGLATQIVRVYIEWEEVASTPSAQNEFLFTYPWVKVAATANYAYNSFFNPAVSGKTAIIKRIGFGTNTSDGAAAIYQNISLRRTTSASNGTAITASDVPEKNTSGATSVMDFRHTNVTVSLVGTADARLGMVTPGTTGYPTGWQEIKIQDNDEKIILQPGEGIVLISEAAGDANQLARMMLEWQEVSSGSTPSSQGEYIFAYPRVVPGVAPAVDTNFYTFFNPSGSGKTAVVKRLVIRNNADTTATYPAFNFRRITAASSGVQITASDVPKKHSGTADSAMEARYCGTTCGTALSATRVGTVDSRLMTVNGPGTATQVIGQREIAFGDNEKLVLQEGEGIVFYNDVLAGDIDHYYKILVEWDEESSAPSSQGEYLLNVGPVNGSTSSGYNYISFFNPGASGKTAIVKRVSLRIDSISTALYIPMTLRRSASASGGTQITAANIPKKHSGTANSIMEIRRTGVTVGLAGSADSRFTGIQTAGVAGTAIAPSISGYKEFGFTNDERIILQPGEGVGLYQEAAGDADFRVKVLFEWEEVASGSTPSSQGEYLMSSGPVNGDLNANYVYSSLFNPSGSNKNYVVKRIEIRANRVGALTAPGNIPVTIRKTSAASGGTQVTLADIPKKHSGTLTTTADVRHTGPTVTFAGVSDSRLLGFTVPGTVNQYGDYESKIIYGDEMILAPGEGLALYQEATAGDILLRFRFAFEWSESDAGVSNQNPDTPSNLGPAGYIDAAGWMNDNTPTFNFDITDPDTADLVKYRIQIDDTAGFGSVVLDYQPSSFGAEGTYDYTVGQAGSYAVGSESMTLNDSAVGGGYYWRVKAIDDDLAESAYEEAGVDSTIDFRVDANAPTGLIVYDGTELDVDHDYSGTALNSLAANWTAANFDISGPATPNKYQYAIGTTAGGADILTWTPTNIEHTVVTANGLTVNTAIMYFWTVKATDLAGNVTTISSNGQMIEPTISFSFDTPTVTFALGTPTWTESKNTIITTQTNASSGYNIQAYALGLLTQLDPPYDEIDEWSGTYALPGPTAWAGNCVDDSECGFGYTSSDPNITTGSRGNMYNNGLNYCAYAKPPEAPPGDVVADNDGPTIDGSRVLINQNFTLTHKVAVDQNQIAGQYQTTLMLIVTANY